MKSAVDPRALSRERRNVLISREACADLLGVTERTARNWEAAKTRIPYSASKLLRVLAGGQVPGRGVGGFLRAGKHPLQPGWESFHSRGTILSGKRVRHGAVPASGLLEARRTGGRGHPGGYACAGDGVRVIHMSGLGGPGPVDNPPNDSTARSVIIRGKLPRKATRKKLQAFDSHAEIESHNYNIRHS